MELRKYQRDAIDALVHAWKNESLSRSAMIASTGSGKTVTFAHLIREVRRKHGIAKVLVIAHRDELLAQAQTTIRAVAPHLHTVIMDGGSTTRGELARADVVIAGVQTLGWRQPCRSKIVRKRGAQPSRCGECGRCTHLPNAAKVRGVQAIIADEAHHFASPINRRVLDWFGGFTGDVPVWGFTATMAREAGGLAEVWQKIAYTIGLPDLIDQGYLVPPHAKQVRIPGMDLDQAQVRNGDFTTQSLAELMLNSDAMADIAHAYREYAGDRPGIVFCPSVEVTHAMASEFNAAGITAAPVWGSMGEEARRKTLSEFRNGDVQVLVNCMILTEGFDEPKASCIVIARPTQSRGLYAQMLGRGMRLSPETGKQDLLILDVHGATTRHTLATLDDVTEPKEEKQGKQGRPGPDEEDEKPEASPEDASPQEMKTPLQVAGWVDVEGLFAKAATKRSGIRWLRSPEGVWFAPFGGKQSTVVCAVVPSTIPERWDLYGIYSAGAYTKEDSCGLTMAEVVSKVETVQMHKSHPFDDPNAGWRRNKPSEKQMKYARKVVREEIPDNATTGQVNDLIARWTTGRQVDGVLQQAMNAMEMV